MAAAAGTAAVPSAAALEATGRRARDPRVRAGGSRARTVHRPTWLGLGMAACRTQPPNRAHQPHPSRTRPTARVCTEGRFDLARAHAAHGGLQGRPSCSRGGCLAHAPCGGAPTTRAGARRAQPDIATATRSRAAPRSRVLTRAPWPTRAALGAPWCGPCGGGTRAWSTPLACAQGPCMDRGRGRRPSPSRPRPWWARSSALEPTTRSSPEMPQVLVRGVVNKPTAELCTRRRTL